ALADLSATMSKLGLSDGLLIGGIMVSLHAHRWGRADLYRETRDVDFGMPLALAKDPELIRCLIEDHGYRKVAGNRFERTLPAAGQREAGPGLTTEARTAAIDLLVPAYTSRARANVRVADHLVATEVPGLATALRRPAIAVELEVTRLDGEQLLASAALPDE